MTSRSTRLPTITFSDDADYDTVGSVLNGWTSTITYDDGRSFFGQVMFDGQYRIIHIDTDINEVIDFDHVVAIEVA